MLVYNKPNMGEKNLYRLANGFNGILSLSIPVTIGYTMEHSFFLTDDTASNIQIRLVENEVVLLITIT